MIGLESLAYAITRGCVRAYLDVLRESQLAEVEKPTAADLARADAFRAAVAGRMRFDATGQTGRRYSPSDQRNVPTERLVNPAQREGDQRISDR